MDRARIFSSYKEEKPADKKPVDENLVDKKSINENLVDKKPVDKMPVEVKIEINRRNQFSSPGTKDIILSTDRLQEAIIWSEILDKPLCKRRKRR